MGKRMKLPFPSFIKSTTTQQLDPHHHHHQQTWPWPSCGNSTKTLSFRSSFGAPTTTADMFRTINSAYEEMGTTTSESSPPPQLGGNPVDSEDDSFIQGVVNHRKQSDHRRRLFFTPGETNSILEEAKTKKNNSNRNGEFLLLGGGTKEIKNVVMEEMESTNPYIDFRKSMEEMVEANQGLKGSMQGLQELLSCYLSVNGKDNHGYIVGAFVDLLTSLSLTFDDEQNHNNLSSSSNSNSPISALSFTSNSSSCTSSTARSTTPCSVEEGGEESTSCSSSTSKKTDLLAVVESDRIPVIQIRKEIDASPSSSCSLQV